MGPVSDKAAARRIDAAVEAAMAYAKPIVRGGPALDPPLAEGAFGRLRGALALTEFQEAKTYVHVVAPAAI